MWRMFRSMGGYSTPYDDIPDNAEKPKDPSDLLLDPITCAGRVQIQKLKEAAEKLPCLAFTAKAFDFLLSEDFYNSIRKEPHGQDARRR